MPLLRLFGPAAEAAGTRAEQIQGATVGDVLEEALRRFGPLFCEVASKSKLWVNGEPAELADAVRDTDEVALLPPVSGGQ